MENLRAIVDESKKAGALVMVHAVTPQAMMAAVDAGVPLLVHTPHFGWVTDEEARKVAAAGVLNLSTTAFGVPLFDVFSQDNVPTFRDGGADTGYLPAKGLAQELKTLNLMFSMKDIVKVMGPNSAAFMQMSKDIGTLEAGKLADIVVLPANPLDGYCSMYPTLHLKRHQRIAECARCDALRDAIEKTHALALIWFCVMRKPSPDDVPRRHQHLVGEILDGDPAKIADAVREHLAVGKRHTLELLEPYFRLHTAGTRRVSRLSRNLGSKGSQGSLGS